jgi:hypothetical protein
MTDGSAWERFSCVAEDELRGEDVERVATLKKWPASVESRAGPGRNRTTAGGG